MVSSRSVKMVASQWRPVDPEGTQGRYIRSTTSLQDSDKLRWHQNCVANAMENNGGSQSDVRQAFANAAEQCRQENPH